MFEEFRKIARLNRTCVISEKIDGTNAQILIAHKDTLSDFVSDFVIVSHETEADVYFKDGTTTKAANVADNLIFAGSRSRWVTPGQNDNHGFARWVFEHAQELSGLGLGRHFGEWWGSGIQRGYGLQKGEKRFSLFNTSIWSNAPGMVTRPACCHVVPTLFEGPFKTENIERAVEQLRSVGSYAAPGFKNAEGIVVYHTHANQYFKVTLTKDELPKSLVDKTAEV